MFAQPVVTTMLAHYANFAQVLGFIIYVVLTLIDWWPKMEFKINRHTLALACLVLALVAWGTSYLIEKTKTTQQEADGAPTQTSLDWASYKKTVIINKHFRNERIVLDGKSFSNCIFDNVSFEWNGTAPFDLVGNTISDSSRVLASNNRTISAWMFFLKEFRFLRDGIEIVRP